MKREELGGGVEKRGKLWEGGLLLVTRKRRGGPTSTTTPVVSWKDVGGAQNPIIKGVGAFNNNNYYNYNISSSSSSFPQLSARELAASLWEFHHYFYLFPATMNLGANNRHHFHQRNEDDVVDHHRCRHHHPNLAVGPNRGGSPDPHPGSASSLRRHIAASLMRHHQSAGRNNHALDLEPLSPASYGSSLEMAPHNPAATPDSSIELRGRIGDSRHSFKTSTELLKILNRIWSLEEQHTSNVSLVKALKKELDHARAKIKELIKDQQENRREIDELMKHISEDNLARKNREQEQIDAALESMRNELEDERKLRKRSESLHRKLARELFEIKVAFSTTGKDLEKERKSRELLEDLCDEFAKGIREYARQVRAVKHKSDKDWPGLADHERLILNMSESWLDERIQMKEREAEDTVAKESSIVDKMRHEIEVFLASRRTVNVGAKDTVSPRDPKETRLRRHSLESIPEASSAPRCVGHEDSSFSGADINRERHTTHGEHVDLALNTTQEIDPRILKTGEGNPTEISMLQKSEIYETLEEETFRRRKPYNDELHGIGSSSKTVDKLMSELLMSEGGSFPPEYECKEVAVNRSPLRRNASPSRQWMTSMKSPDPRISESSSKMQAVRENTLKAKLQEPKSKGARPRLKILKGSS